MKIIRNLLFSSLFVLVFGFGFMGLSSTAQAQFCIVGISVDPDPRDNTPFNYIASGALNDNFVLTSDASIVLLDFPVGVTNVTQQLPAGWQLDDIICVVDGTGGDCGGPCLTFNINEAAGTVTVNCLAFESGSCTWINSLEDGPPPTPGPPTPPPSSTSVPTISEWGLIAMAGVMALVAFFALRRKKAIS